MLSHFCHVQLFETLWTVAHQAPLFIRFSRQEYWSELPFLPPGDLPNPEREPESLRSPLLEHRFFTTSVTWEAPCIYISVWWLRQSRTCLQCGRPGIYPWVGKIPWRTAWRPTPVFLPGEYSRRAELCGIQPIGSQRVRYIYSIYLLYIHTLYTYVNNICYMPILKYFEIYIIL